MNRTRWNEANNASLEVTKLTKIDTNSSTDTYKKGGGGSRKVRNLLSNLFTQTLSTMSSQSKVIAITSAAVTAQGKKNKLELAKALVAAKGVKGLDNIRGETDVDMDSDSNAFPPAATQWMAEEMGKGRGL